MQLGTAFFDNSCGSHHVTLLLVVEAGDYVECRIVLLCIAYTTDAQHSVFKCRTATYSVAIRPCHAVISLLLRTAAITYVRLLYHALFVITLATIL